MIIVYCGLKQDYIISEIEKFKKDDKQVFNFIKKDDIRLYFNSILEDDVEACYTIRYIINKSEYGQILFYNVVPFDGKEITWFY